MPDDDQVFKALGDPTRRFLLDLLHQRDGRSLGELEAGLAMTRFGVMKHLRVLEDAHLVVTRWAGRKKLHYLNPVPIRQVHDRWLDKYTASVASGLTALKRDLEAEPVMEKVFEIYIKTTPDRVWNALTDPEQRKRFSFGVALLSDWKAGSPYVGRATEMTHAEGAEIYAGEVLESDPPRRLVLSFRARWSDAIRAEGESRITWEIEPVGDSCKVTLIHDRLRADANPQLYGGHPMVLSGLKTWLESGEMLTTPASLQFVRA